MKQRAIFTLRNDSNLTLFKAMTIKLQLPDAVYASLLKGNARVQGTIALVSPREGNFNVHNRKREHPAREYRKLPHGRVSMSEESVRLTLNINLDEAHVRPADIIIYESATASNFVMGTCGPKADPSPSLPSMGGSDYNRQ